MKASESFTRLIGKRTRLGKLVELFLGRSTIIALLFLIQLGLMILLIAGSFLKYQWLFLLVNTGSQIVMTIYILNSDSAPEIKLSWIVIILLVPVVGIPLYFYIRFDLGHRAQKKILGDEGRRGDVFKPSGVDPSSFVDRNQLRQISTYLGRYASSPTYKGTRCEYFPFGKDGFECLLEDISKAEKFIFLEYFIVEEGYMWGNVLSLLIEKARNGVEVRMLYDGLNAYSTLPYNYAEKLAEVGIEARMFSPIRPLVSTHYNNRDHRKILVVDNKVAYTGGINLADEYIGRKLVYGLWKDNLLRVEGEAVSSLTLTFLKAWNAISLQTAYEPYLIPHSVEDDGIVIPYADSPLDNERVGESVYLSILESAKRYCYIMTPYLIIDSEMSGALKQAAKRGVDVRIILPHIPDKKYAFALAKTHYKELLGAGVKIYEFTPGFIHSKVFLADDREAVVGTINLDYRSLYLHFENAVYLYEAGVLGAIRKDFQDTFELSMLVDPVRWRPSFCELLFGRLLKVIAPLM